MRLSNFIRSHQEDIIAEWEAFARTCMPIGHHMDRSSLRDHIIELLNFIVNDLDSFQTDEQQSEKSKGRGPRSEGAAEAHGEQRFNEGFDTLEMLSEFRALRASVIKLWMVQDHPPEEGDITLKDIIRFNEAIDQVMTESLDRFTAKEMRARSLFLGTLIHDFRTPLGAISMSAQLLLRKGQLAKDDADIVAQIERSVANISHLVSNMIDVVRIRLGRTLPLTRTPMDLGAAINETVQEAQSAYPHYKITVTTEGDLRGSWDRIRIRQVLSNLVGNAIQHGEKSAGVDIEAKEDIGEVTLTVHNKGAIPVDFLGNIFQPLTRGTDDAPKSASLGLGLFIAKGIVDAHDGDISVTSNTDEGTTFTVRLPREEN